METGLRKEELLSRIEKVAFILCNGHENFCSLTQNKRHSRELNVRQTLFNKPDSKQHFEHWFKNDKKHLEYFSANLSCIGGICFDLCCIHTFLECKFIPNAR